ncbi:MAG: HEAT repeat domain-containing protein [Planctomycetota bacterium]|jgi:HEAT repeat protein
MRKAAVIATEQIGEAKSFGKVKTAFKKEKELDIKGRMLRAMARVAPINRQGFSLINKALASHKSEFVRAHATVAVGLLEDRAVVTQGLSKALQDRDGLVRSVAAYVIAIRQDKEMLQHLQFALKAEREADVTRNGWRRRSTR